MIQIKQFGPKAKIAEINNFLANNQNCQILSTNPYIIQYEIKEIFEESIMALKGTPLEFIFVQHSRGDGEEIWDDEVSIVSGTILFFNEFIIFEGSNKNFFKVKSSGSFGVTDRKGDELLKVTDFICIPGHGTIDMRHEADFEKFRLRMANCGIITTNSNLLYHERTNSIMTAARMQARATIDSGCVQANAIDRLAMSTIISAQISSNPTITIDRNPDGRQHW
jgi:hypothetical protein